MSFTSTKILTKIIIWPCYGPQIRPSLNFASIQQLSDNYCLNVVALVCLQVKQNPALKLSIKVSSSQICLLLCCRPQVCGCASHS